MNEYSLPKYDADVLTAEKAIADYFEVTLSNFPEKNKDIAKLVSNWVMTDVMRVASERKISLSEFPILPAALSKMITLIVNRTISGKIAKDIFEEMLLSDEDPNSIVTRKGLMQISDESAIEKVVKEIMEKNTAQVEQYRGGSEKVFGFFVGEVMKATKGKANPGVVTKILKRLLT